MKPPLPSRLLNTHRGILLALCILTPDLTSLASAQSEDVLGKAVGISLAISVLVSIIVTFIVICCYHRYMKRRNEMKNAVISREQQQSLLSPQERGETHNRTSIASSRSTNSTRPLSPSRQISYEPVATIDSLKANGDLRNSRNSRMKSDFISRWCTDHNLTEQTATVLRVHGFTTAEAVSSLRPEDIQRLNLHNIAQECILRQVIAPSTLKSSTSAGSGVFRQKSSSEEGLVLTPPLHYPAHDASGTSSVFERTQSVDHIDGGVCTRPKTLTKKKSVGSMEIIEDGGESTIIIRSNSHETPSVIHRSVMGDRENNPKNFKGLLSDKGIDDLSAWIGHEWSRLATLLEIPPSIVDHLQMDHPKSTRKQIYEMLRLWRDSAVGTKEQVKGKLHEALLQVGRSDLAEDLLQEQVDGSCEKVAYHSIV